MISLVGLDALFVMGMYGAYKIDRGKPCLQARGMYLVAQGSGNFPEIVKV